MPSKIVTFVASGWDVSENVYLDDLQRAYYGIVYGGYQTTTYIYCLLNTGQFNNTDTISGIQVTVKRQTPVADYRMKDLHVVFFQGATIISNEKADYVNYWGPPEQQNTYIYKVYGNSSDAWGMSLTGADINTGTFKFGFSAQKMSGLLSTFVYIDYIKIEIFYEAGSVAPTENPYGPPIQVIG